jgi:cell division protein FtsZ
MIDLNRNFHQSANQADTIPIKIIGIGGAGSNTLDRMVLDGIENADLVAMNTDVQSLTGSVAMEKVQLGREATRGLGAGGDPEIGMAAAEESIDEIRKSLEGASMIFICAGLGGGTGSGAAPLVAHLAKEHGALVVVFATMPFAFEGKRRHKQAEEALAALEQVADAVICFDNDKMGEAVSPKAGIHHAFANADVTISQSVRAIGTVFNRPGLIHIGFDDLRAALRGAGARCLFGFGEAEGDNRANEALNRAFKNPLMDKGRMLGEAHNVLINVAGGPEMTLNEVQILMEEFARHIGDDTQVRFGATVDRAMGNRMSVTIVSSVGGEVAAVAQPRPAHARTHAQIRAQTQPHLPHEPEQAPEPESIEEPVAAVEAEHEPAAVPPHAVEAEEELLPQEVVEPDVEEIIEPVEAEAGEPQMLDIIDEPPAPAPEPVAAPTPHVARPRPAVARPSKTAAAPGAPAPAAAKPAEERQATLQFEPVSRGRFEKSEPTIVDGQDLDVPTFLRRNVKVK